MLMFQNLKAAAVALGGVTRPSAPWLIEFSNHLPSEQQSYQLRQVKLPVTADGSRSRRFRGAVLFRPVKPEIPRIEFLLGGWHEHYDHAALYRRPVIFLSQLTQDGLNLDFIFRPGFWPVATVLHFPVAKPPHRRASRFLAADSGRPRLLTTDYRRRGDRAAIEQARTECLGHLRRLANFTLTAQPDGFPFGDWPDMRKLLATAQRDLRAYL